MEERALIKTEVIQTNLPCPGCGYNLRGLPKQQRCPECGFAFDFRSDKSIGGIREELSRLDIFFLCIAAAAGIGLILVGLPSWAGERVQIWFDPIVEPIVSASGLCVARTSYLLWRSSRKRDASPQPRALVPSIYRDPLPDAKIALLDRELDQHLASESISPTDLNSEPARIERSDDPA